jgi:hypothetical protein
VSNKLSNIPLCLYIYVFISYVLLWLLFALYFSVMFLFVFSMFLVLSILFYAWFNECVVMVLVV